MFSDLVGSTAFSARMDPEDLREVISAYQKCVAETVQRFGGFVAKYMVDGVLVYFGYPQAHEDGAERAVGAGLELVGAVSSLKTHAYSAKPGVVFVRCGTRWWRALDAYWRARDEPEQMYGICELNGCTGRVFRRCDVACAKRRERAARARATVRRMHFRSVAFTRGEKRSVINGRFRNWKAK
jgi:class 3 adenylate cyclase